MAYIPRCIRSILFMNLEMFFSIFLKEFWCQFLGIFKNRYLRWKSHLKKFFNSQKKIYFWPKIPLQFFGLKSLFWTPLYHFKIIIKFHYNIIHDWSTMKRKIEMYNLVCSVYILSQNPNTKHIIWRKS